MAKKLFTSPISLLRAHRGLSQEALADLAGVAVGTIRRIERGKGPGFESTWRRLLEAFASVAAFTGEERRAVCDLLGWSVETIDAIEAMAAPQIPTDADRRRTARSRAVSVLDRHPHVAEEIAAVLESLARLIEAVPVPVPVPTESADGPELSIEALSALVERMGRPDSPGVAGVGGGPAGASIPTRRVVLPPVVSGTATVQRFEYYTPDGRRLVPEPPRARRVPNPAKSPPGEVPTRRANEDG